MLREQVETQARYIDEIREVKHDMYAHMMVLSHYMGVEEYEKARTYLSKVMNIPVFQKRGYIDVGHDMVNALLSGKIHSGKTEIAISTSGLLPENLWIDDMDLCILFSNLISNSVEACERLTYKEKEITLIMEEKATALSISMINPIEEEIDIKEFGKYTSKEDAKNHGFGLKNIKRIVNKYHGKIDVNHEGGLVLVKIEFPYVAEDRAL